MANAWIFAPLPITAAAASNTAAGRDPLFVANDYAGIVWQSDGEASPWLRLDLGADVEIDTIALFGLTGFTTAHVATIQVATAAQGTGFGGADFTNFAAGAQVLAGSAMPKSGKGVGLFSVEAPITGRYVKISFSGLPGAVQIACCELGTRIPLERNFGFGGTIGIRDLGSLDFSARGVILRRRGKKLRTLGLTFSNINRDELEAYIQPLFEQLGNTETVTVISDPTADPQRQNRCWHGFLVGELGSTRRNARSYESKINVAAIF